MNPDLKSVFAPSGLPGRIAATRRKLSSVSPAIIQKTRSMLASAGRSDFGDFLNDTMSEKTDPKISAALAKLFSALKHSKVSEQRLQAARDIKQYVSTLGHEMSKEKFNRFMGDVNRLIFELVHSSDPNEKLGGIVIIDELMDIDGEDSGTKVTRANYLRIVLGGSDSGVMKAASQALGHLALAGGTLTADIVEFEVKRALEWLQGDRNEARRHTAILVLSQLATNAPTLFYSHVPMFFDSIFSAVRDPKLQIREDAVAAFRACLAVTAQRESKIRTNWYSKVYEEAKKGLKMGKDDAIHGSLLIIGELFRNTGEFMDSPRFEEACDEIFRFQDSRNPLIQRTVISLFPSVASYKPEIFVRKYLSPCMNHLINCLRREREKQAAFQALGELAIAVGENITPYLKDIIVCIKDALSFKNRSKASQSTDAAVFKCISMLAKAVGPSMGPSVKELLDSMFGAGLTPALTEALHDTANNIPELLPVIQERLLEMLKNTLQRQPYRAVGTPVSVNRMAANYERPAPLQVGAEQDVATKTLALKTLGTFNFKGHNLMTFLRECVVTYVEDENSIIRKEAAQTCSQLLVRSLEQAQKAVAAMGLGAMAPDQQVQATAATGDVLEKLIIVGIADPDPDIRLSVLKSLDWRFDTYLCQAENVRSICKALNDEVFEIRELAVSIVGRLTTMNPAYAMPPLRKALIQLLTEIEFSGISRNKEESARLLAQVIRHARHLMKPYVEAILKALRPKLHDVSPGVASNVLACIGELGEVGGEDMRQYVEDLLPLIIDTLQDQSSVAKREVALRTLGQLCKSTGYVMKPYITHPKLLDILLNFLKTEQAPTTRREVIKVMGILGALDPYKYKMNQTAMRDHEVNFEHSRTRGVTSVGESLMNMGPSHENYYPTVAINALMRILNDPSLSVHHQSVIQAVTFIFKSLGLKGVPFLPKIMPAFLNALRTGEPGFRKFLFQTLASLVAIVKQHIRNYLDDIFQVITEYWNVDSPIQIAILPLVESISLALGGEFKVYLSQLMPQILRVFIYDDSDKRASTVKMLHALDVFGTNLDDYLHLIIPVIMRQIEAGDVPMEVRANAVQTLGRLSRKLNFSEYASRIIHPLARILETAPELRDDVMKTLSALVYQLGADYAIFIPMVSKVLAKQRIQAPRYEKLVSALLRNHPLPRDSLLDEEEKERKANVEDSAAIETGTIKKLHVNQQTLKKTWEASQRSTKDDWLEWIRKFSTELLRESPSPALRSCSILAQSYYPLARELFNAAFVSCWAELYETFQDELVKNIQLALQSSNIPPETTQTLLNLAEFMEHDDKKLPIDTSALGEYAAKCHAYAKALHYKEIEFHNEPTTEVIESLISINNQLKQQEAANGILVYARKNDKEMRIQESWYEKLQQWDQALELYEGRQNEDPNNVQIILGRMRCLHALGRWNELHVLSQEKWKKSDEATKRVIAPMAAAAAWGLGTWACMDDYISVMRRDSPDGAFFRSILAIHKNEYTLAQNYIDRTRDLLDTELTALAGESFNRAYRVVVRVQMLSELEEIIQYKRCENTPEAKVKQAAIRRMWMNRLKGCQRNVEVWQRILNVRALVISRQEDEDMWLKFSSLCRKNNLVNLSHKTLTELLGFDPAEQPDQPLPTSRPRVAFAYLKHVWDEASRLTGDDNENVNPLEVDKLRREKMHIMQGRKEECIHLLSTFLDNLLHQRPPNDPSEEQARRQLLARCFLKLGQWKQAVHEPLTDSIIADVLSAYHQAAQYDRNWYKAWHTWALTNFEAVSHYEKCIDIEKRNKDSTDERDRLRRAITRHCATALTGFFRSISLSKGNSLQDTLRLLTLWFKYGSYEDVGVAMNEGIKSVAIDTWLQVIPQLIARIHTPSVPVRRLIHDLLTEIGNQHPQALIYPLTVASKSQSVQRRDAALAITEKMRQHSAILVDQALLVSSELIRVAILWHEMWHEGLEDASRLWFGEENFEAMYATLEPLHQMINKGPETLREISFNQSYGKELQEAHEWTKKYARTRNEHDLSKAWELYYSVFRRIAKQLPQLTSLELQYVSPRLLEARDLELAVPGTYHSGEEVIRIRCFAPTLTVITSKQRPRKLTITGSDGQNYNYLLKGHEDLRQDERVMQLFGLVNTLLASDPETFKRHLNIQRYSVIPLSPKSGLIGWVPHCDTLHALIKDYRDSRKILLNIEHRIMLQMAPDFDHLTVPQKVEVFDHALDTTTGQDLYKVLWLKSPNSEAWLDRRTNYTRSLAVMSMVGYILGLGDRHPSNLMLDRFSGKILHIDFGDCFEVAMHREKFPEKVPFRLTRMLINAMEVSGLEGNYRTTCNHTLRVMRDNRDSLMAVLEAFVYDPLINWRLMETGSAAKPQKKKKAANEELADTSGAYTAYEVRSKQKGEDELLADDIADAQPEVFSERAVSVINRVQAKLTGRDFKATESLSVEAQVQRLITQASSHENLCQLYIGWCPFW